jgi:hypothetical protein
MHFGVTGEEKRGKVIAGTEKKKRANCGAHVSAKKRALE